jgi:hypothetical protein
MRKLIAILALCSIAFGADEIKRPTVDTDPGAQTWSTNNCGIGTYTASTTSGALARDGAGQATSVRYFQISTGGHTRITSRQWATWGTTTFTYSALTLNVNSSSTGSSASPGSKACLTYSLDSGATWTAIRCSTDTAWAQVTDSIALSATQNLNALRLGMCTLGVVDDGIDGAGFMPVTIYDIWTDGVYAVASSSSSVTPNAQRHRSIIF